MAAAQQQGREQLPKLNRKYIFAVTVFLGLLLQPSQPLIAGKKKLENNEIRTISECIVWLDSRSLDDAPKFKAISDQLACYDGKVDVVEGEILVDWLSFEKTFIRKSLVVRSRGGPVESGLPMGEAILKAGAKVFIFDVCGSSCANYIFSPARHRFILPNSLVLFHGGMSVHSIDRGLALAKKELSKRQPDPLKAEANLIKIEQELTLQLVQQRKLMTKAGVTANFLERYETLDLELLAEDQCTSGKNRNFVFLSQSQLEKIGIKALGEVVESVDQATGILANLNTDLGETAVCIAPEKLFQESQND